MKEPRFSNYEVVSFDMFDTLVSRLVNSPRDVFVLVEARTGVKGFAEARVVAERAARAGGKPETTLDEIYEKLRSFCPQNETRASLKLCELQVEKDACVANKQGMRLYEAAKTSGARIVITSDMYLPGNFLREILQSCGYTGWERLFVSCEHRATKGTGVLYEVVAKELGTKPAQILHVGDNLKSDFLRARQKGFAARRLKLAHTKSIGLEESFVISAQASRYGSCVNDSDYLENFGYSCLGPILTGFCKWLIHEFKKEGIEKVFYLSRDGLIVQRAMRELGAFDYIGTYLYASRRALQVPSIALLDSFEDIIDSMFLPKKISLRKLFYKMGLDGEYVAQVLRKDGIDPDAQRNSNGLATDEDAVRAYLLLCSAIHSSAEEEYRLLIAYLKQSNFEGKLAIVDIGWFGNMQLALERVCTQAGIEADINGYYVGLEPDGRNQRSHDMRGYLFDAKHGLAQFEREHCFNFLLETLFSAPHGTTRKYERSSAGDVIPVLADYSGSEALVGNLAEQARVGALQFVGDWSRILGSNSDYIAPDLAQRAFDKVGLQPTLPESLFFGAWVMEADGELIRAAAPQTVSHYLRHPKQLIRDYAQTSWKPGFMCQLLKLPLPYGDIRIRLRRVAKRILSRRSTRSNVESVRSLDSNNKAQVYKSS